MVHTVKDRRQIGKATYILKMGEMLQSTEVLPARYTPKHDENLNLAGSIGHEAERYASIVPDGGQFSAGGKTRGRCSGRERE